MPLLNLKIYPRMSLYLSEELSGSFIIDAEISYYHGERVPGLKGLDDHDVAVAGEESHLVIEVTVPDLGLTLITDKEIKVNTSANDVVFVLDSLPPRYEPYDVVLRAVSHANDHEIGATTQLSVLPPRTDGGSITKLDRLHGGLWVRDTTSSSQPSTPWTPLLPYSYYVSWGGWLASAPAANARALKAAGYNIVHAVPPVDYPAFNSFLDACDALGLWVMYDMRHTYSNASAVRAEVQAVQSRPSLLLYYTADEPDGTSDPLSAPRDAASLIRTLDPYRPVSLALNCADFHYAEYTRGADLILADPYPIAVDTAFSTVYGTVCNATYGCCGCDNCAGAGVADVRDRLDAYARHERVVNASPPRPRWLVPQAFGNESFWRRFPTGAESVAMAALGLNYGARGVMGWIYPTSAEVDAAHGGLAKALDGAGAARFMLGAPTVGLSVSGRDVGKGKVDAAAWTVGGKTLVSVVNVVDEEVPGEVRVRLPVRAKTGGGFVKNVWGDTGIWAVEGYKLVAADGLGSFQVNIFVVETSLDTGKR